FSLTSVAINSASKFWPVSLMVFVLIVVFSLVSKNKFANIFAILSSIILTYLFCLALSKSGTFTEGHPAYINLDLVNEASWLRDAKSAVWTWGIPKFSAVAIGAMLAGFFAVMIETIGDYHSCAYSCGVSDPDEKTIARGVGAEGICCMLSGGLFGGVGTTSYTENIGLINLTGVASRNVVRTGAVMLIIMGFVGKLGALIATMPDPIIGGSYIALFGTIGALGIQVLMRANMGSQRNIMIVGFAFLMSQGLPGWIETNKELFMPDGAGELVTTLGGMAWALLKTPMAVAGLCAGICDNLVPGTPEERGITKSNS
ncbi:MAG: solute carrier family 23 protein, partial [Synergistaceae bacterium]|nr:solute carrier family 23 protein [Synergistaceae bacterium]